MTAPPMPPLPPLGAAPAAPPAGGPPMPPMAAPPPLMGGALSPQAVTKQIENNALAAGYLASKRATAQALQSPAPMPAAGAALPPPALPPVPMGAPPLASGMASSPVPLAPPPGPGTAAPAPVAPPAMAEGGVVGGNLNPPGVDLLPGVVPAPLLLAAYLDRFGGQGHVQRFADGGMVSPELMALLGGANGSVAGDSILPGNSGDGNPLHAVGSGIGGVASGVQPGAGALGDDALTPDEAASVDAMNAGPPVPKAFENWVKSGAAQASDYPLDREVYEAAMAAPDKLKAIFEYARAELKVDPSEGSPALKKAVGLPTGQLSLDQKIQAGREEMRG